MRYILVYCRTEYGKPNYLSLRHLNGTPYTVAQQKALQENWRHMGVGTALIEAGSQPQAMAEAALMLDRIGNRTSRDVETI